MAIGTLTAVPVKPPRTLDRAVAGGAMVLAPIAAIPLAVAAGAVMLLPVPALVSAGLAIGVVALGSRGLHLDGLADTADGLSASYHRERALEIMRRGDSGPSGVAALALILIVQCGALAGAAGAGHGSTAAVLAVFTGRAVLSACCARGVPSARPSGLGATVAGSVPILLAALVFLAATTAAAFAPGLPWWRGPLAVAVGYACVGLLLLRCVRRLGGITGDVLGACTETAATATLVMLS
ncbi:adenosylcobinamide-GDP ribazoletransferase [Amycolatopsis pigmentata]|uniref:Adenosylcobinamide-GDP ribazoletransferase n=1 Tax=Amycolatopsis pigmentata TaxID=450801 RepID=A0ABW5FWZ7_9PSEU